MTNKINGIDVSECEYFEKQHIEDMYESSDCNVCIDNFCALCWKECEKHNGCYFKQLKRLQKENDELKEKITKFRWDNPYYDLYNNVVGQRDNLEKENEELREEKDGMQIVISNYIEHTTEYRQALEEIKDRLIMPDSLPENYTLKRYILEKCNEVLK